MKILPFILVIFLTITPVLAADICKERLTPGQECIMLTPVLPCTGNYSIFNETDFVRQDNLTALDNGIYYFTFNETKGDYIISLCDNSTREIIVEGEDKMASLSIMIFVLVITGVLFILPLIKKFSNYPITDMIIKRSCWLVGIYLMMLNSAIAATIAENAGLELTQEMFRYMWLFGAAGWIGMIILVIKTLFDVIRSWKVEKENKRMGDDELYGKEGYY